MAEIAPSEFAAPFDFAVATICQNTYDPSTSVHDLVYKVAGAAIGLAMMRSEEPEEMKKLLAPHPLQNPHTPKLTQNMTLFLDVFSSHQFQNIIREASRKADIPLLSTVIKIVLDRYEEVHGAVTEENRLEHIAAVANHYLRFALLLARDHPTIASEYRAAMKT
jgi:hypothetical protein